ncbi:ER degradation-enhancing alpha-mannosidase-like protein 2 isoform X2 [Cephus cinctus]|uniref:alpha-1,2-Mannosidase n=1 Tax=Cephus cinctus TaxID=211228 RepID=A0AAJ7W0F1_CEPCN|nr:ER degradation-enhancing alpha-mannosidase-like protein 2 isoform X2 [Cephus cinctus]
MMTSLRFIWLISYLTVASSVRTYEKKDLITLREEVRSMFDHAYTSYLKVAEIIGTRTDFEANINVSVFETNIRVVGGLLSAHLLSHKAGLQLEPGWPCNGPLLRLAEDMAKRLIAAFDTPTGMPYGTVNLKYGVPEGETSITCTAGIGTFLLEFGTLSRLTGDPLYEEVAMNAVKALHYYKSNIGLVGNHVDVLTGHWTAQDSGIGAGVDSYFEYLAKGTLLLQDPLLGAMFREHRAAIEKYVRREDWHLWVSMTKGQVTLPVFQSLDAYWPGVLSLFGEIGDAMKSLHNYHQVWKQFGFTPEFYNIPQAEAGTNREGYPLRPELIESVMYLYRATDDPYLIQVGVDVLRSLQHSAKTTCGYATINDVRDHRKADRMESFFLAETTKYLYLLFDPDNFIHESGQRGDVVETQWGRCVVNAGGYIFNTEAHPIDPGALQCCRPTQNMFPSKKSSLRRFIVPKDQDLPEATSEPINHGTDPENARENHIKIIKLSDMRQTSEESISTNKQSDIPETDTDTILEQDTSSKNALNDMENLNESSAEDADLSKTQIIAPPNVIYKADDSDTIETFDLASGSNEYSSSERNESRTANNVSYSKRAKFEPQIMLETIRRINRYPRNMSAKIDYQSLSCQSQSFLRRISIVGEFFDS